jgi:hypothetical protein
MDYLLILYKTDDIGYRVRFKTLKFQNEADAIAEGLKFIKESPLVEMYTYARTDDNSIDREFVKTWTYRIHKRF